MTDTPERPTPDHSVQDRLRDALAARARTIEPSPDGLRRIEEKLMTETTPTGNVKKWWIGGASVAAAVLLGVVALVATSDDPDESGVSTDPTSTTSSSSTTSSTTSTTADTTPTTEAFTPEVDPFAVAYPGPGTSQRFDSPESAGASYATDVLGFTDLEVVEYREGDSRSGEVIVTDRPGGPETAVLVRQMEDDTWYVLGSQTGDIVVDTPSAGDAVSSPFETTGSALAFEGTVEVVVRTQDDPAPIGEGFVTGSGVPPAGPFSGSIEFTVPTAGSPGDGTPGIVIYRTSSAEDGHVTQATSFPIRLRVG